MPRAKNSFRTGHVKGYLRGTSWYLCYYENGLRRRPRVGSDLNAAKILAAQTNAQLECGAVSMLSFEPISIPDLRTRWLEHHEHVLRSSLHTIDRYRTATDHLLHFLKVEPAKLASLFSARHAERFVRYLRNLSVAPNGHPHSAKRPLFDKGLRFILECCRALFNYAAKRRHLSPYATNPFGEIDIDRIPIEDVRPIVLLTPEQEVQFLNACDDWQIPVFATLMLTGLRPGELCHLLVEDIDLGIGVLRVRNKPALGWQIKTRSERDVPLQSVLVEILRLVMGGRTSGAAFRQRRCTGKGHVPSLDGYTRQQLEVEVQNRQAQQELELKRKLSRGELLAVARHVWRELAALKEDRVRSEFIRVCRKIGLSDQTAPKLLRHGFATALQDANVDPLVRNILMGHSPAGERRAGGELGMTAVYTHTRPQTIRQQLEDAMIGRPVLAAAQAWMARHCGSCDTRATAQLNVAAHAA